MFERYTEKARRTIFFARYEASHYGSQVINAEHLLLGLIREDKTLYRWMRKVNLASLRQRIDEHLPHETPTATSVDIPLDNRARSVLKHAADEADGLGSRNIGTEHLFLGLLAEDCLAAQLLREGGAEVAAIRTHFADKANQEPQTIHSGLIRVRDYHASPAAAIEIHGVKRNADLIHEAVQRCHMHKWHWQKRALTNNDIVIEKKTGKVSFDLKLAEDSENFELVKGGWKKDRCFICRWELFESQSESDAEHSTGYTNGHIWLCTECYGKFWGRPDFFASSYSDIT
jgi:hypothetical protein